jgi:hypothetical protein
MKDRNLTLHTYKEDYALEIYEHIQEYYPEIQKVFEKIKKLSEA